jgi:hypothetical protein
MLAVWLASILRNNKWHKLYFTQQQRTVNKGLVFTYCILYKFIVRYIKNFASWTIFELFAVQKERSSFSVQERFNQDSPEKNTDGW